MQPAISYSLLDELVVDLVKEQNSLRFGEKCTTSKNPTEILAALQHIRECLEDGNMDDALQDAEPFFESIFSEEIRFLLYKQQFVEMIRKGAPIIEILEMCTYKLRPLALHATVDSYRDFLQSLLTLVYKDESKSPAIEEWDTSRRLKLANLVYATLCNEFENYECQLSMMMRYLARIFDAAITKDTTLSDPQIDIVLGKLLRFNKEAVSKSSEHMSRLMSGDRDTTTLMNVLSITKMQAVQALNYGKGKIQNAVRNEALRVSVDFQILFPLLKEYCDFRGLVCDGFDNFLFDTSPPTEAHQDLMNIRSLSQRKQFDKVLEVLSTKYPLFLSEDKNTHFSLIQATFLEMLVCGRNDEALSFSNTCFAPFVASNPQFYQAFRDSTVMLIFEPKQIQESVLYKNLNLDVLVAEINTRLVKFLAIQEPRLVSILNRLLFCHTKWFQIQKMDDPFKSLFPIEQLKKHDSLKSDAVSNSGGRNEPPASPSTSVSSPAPVSSAPLNLTEDSILLIMEIAGISRGEALAYLVRHNGDMDAVITSFFP